MKDRLTPTIRFRLRRAALLIATAVCLWAGGRCLDRANHLGDVHLLFSRDTDEAAPPEYILASSLLGGFRGIFITGLWMHAQELKETGRYYEMVDVYKIILTLQPHHASAWRYQAWDLTYNVSNEFTDDLEHRVYWVFRGIDLLRKEAVQKVPRTPELYWELAWYFHHKLGTDLDPAVDAYRAHLAEQVLREVRSIPPNSWELYDKIATLQAESPTKTALLRQHSYERAYQRLLDIDPDLDLPRGALDLMRQPPESLQKELANEDTSEFIRNCWLWQIGQDLEQKLGMRAREMHSLCARFGPIDWRNPESHTLYWATLGERVLSQARPREFTTRYRYLVYRAAMSLVTAQDELVTGEGVNFFTPRYQFLEQTTTYAKQTLEHFEEQNVLRRQKSLVPVDTGLMTDAYMRFLTDVALNSAIDGNVRVTENILAELDEFTVEDSDLAADPARFIDAELAGALKKLGREDTRLLLGALYAQSCRVLIQRGEAGYRRKQAWLEAAHTAALRTWGAGFVPTVAEIRVQTIERILVEGWPEMIPPEPAILAQLVARLRLVDPTVISQPPK